MTSFLAGIILSIWSEHIIVLVCQAAVAFAFLPLSMRISLSDLAVLTEKRWLRSKAMLISLFSCGPYGNFLDLEFR
jgi:hypothetical protein